MGATFGISIDTDIAKTESALADLQNEIRAGRNILRGIGKLVKGQTQKRINNDKRAPDGDSWPKWSPEYAKTREPQHSLLIASGHLFKSITYVENGSVTVVGSNMGYAKYLQEGTSKMPRREFLGLSQDDKDDIEATVLRNVRRIMRSRNA